MLLREHVGSTLPCTIDGENSQTTYLTRVDPLSGSVARISEGRARRNIGISADLSIKPVEKCDFCNYELFTPKERIVHALGAISVPNKFPWEKYDWITIYPPFGEHKLLLSDLYFDDLERMIESSYDLAVICSRDPDVFAFIDFTNWGPFAGASQQHPHSQRKSVTFTLDPKQMREVENCRHLAKKYGRNPFDVLAEEELADGRRVIHNDAVFIASAFAPTCPNEVVLFPHEPIAHILQTTEQQRRQLIRPILGIFPALFFYLGVTDLNIAVHQAPFKEIETARRYYRWHMHVYPRRHRLPIDRAGAEIGFETNVIDSLPENTASALRQWYQEGPKPHLLAKQADGSPNQGLMAEFNRLMNRPLLQSS